MIVKLADYIVSPLGMGTRANYEAVKAGKTRLRRYEGLWGLPEPFVASLMDDALLARILVPLSVLPLMVPRGLLFFFRNYCYFLPVFLLGIFFARNREMCMDFIIRHIRSIVHIAVFSTLLVFINFYLDFIPNTETAYFIQKTTIGMCAILLLERKQTPSPLLDLLARYSFPLFFLHVIVQNICDPVLFTGLLGLWGSLVPVSLLVAFVEMGLCVGLVFLLKKGLGKRSRYVIGG